MIEEWRDIKNYENVYQISSLGTIGNCARGLTSYKTAGGYKWRYVDES